MIIEIPMNADPVKYEVDKETGAIFVDRFMSTAMHYPTNYGYVPRTISGDGGSGGRSRHHPCPIIPRRSRNLSPYWNFKDVGRGG